MRTTRRALTLIEVVISTMLIAGLMLAAMNAVGASVLERERTVDQARGQLLAEDLLDAISALPYSDPDLAIDLGIIKIESDEGSPTQWGSFDDVDDFDGWSASPPTDGDGTALAGYSKSWTRSVEVKLVNADTLADLGVLSGGQGVKRITVTVTHDRKVVGRAVGLRTLGADAIRSGMPPADASDDGGGLLDVLGIGGLLGR